MPKLTIIRPYESLNPKKNIYVYIDGHKIGHIASEQTVHFDVSPDIHKVMLRHNWIGGSQAIEVDMKDNENKTIQMATSKYALLIVPLIVFITLIISSGIIVIFDLGTSFLMRLLITIPITLLFYIPYISRYYMKLEEVEEPANKIMAEQVN